MIISYRESLSLLLLEPGYTDEQLKTAYRKAAHSHHPDKGGDAEKFKQIVAAYEFLKKYEAKPQMQNNPASVRVHMNNGGYTITYYF